MNFLIFKNIALYFLGMLLLAALLVVVTYYDTPLKDDNIFGALINVAWAAYVYCKAAQEIKETNL